MVETGAIVPPFVVCLSAMNVREDIDIRAKNKRFASERPPVIYVEAGDEKSVLICFTLGIAIRRWRRPTEAADFVSRRRPSPAGAFLCFPQPPCRCPALGVPAGSSN
jgi:hypothetical protein